METGALGFFALGVEATLRELRLELLQGHLGRWLRQCFGSVGVVVLRFFLAEEVIRGEEGRREERREDKDSNNPIPYVSLSCFYKTWK